MGAAGEFHVPPEPARDRTGGTHVPVPIGVGAELGPLDDSPEAIANLIVFSEVYVEMMERLYALWRPPYA